MISYNGTQYTTATDTFHQLIDGANVFGFNFYQAEDALTMNQAIQNAILDLTIIASTPATPVIATGPPPPPPMPSQAALAALGSKDQADDDSSSKNNSFASSLAGAKLKKSPSTTPASSISEQSRQAPVATGGGGGGLMSEMQMKLNKRKDPAAAAPTVDKQQSAPAQVDFRSQLKAKTAAVGAKDSAPVAPKEAKEDAPAAPKFTLPRKKEEVAAPMPEPRQDVPQALAPPNIDSESIFNRFKQPEPPATEEKPKSSRGFKSAAVPKPKEEEAPSMPATAKKPGKAGNDDDWDDDSKKKSAPPPAVASPAQGKRFPAPPAVPPVSKASDDWDDEPKHKTRTPEKSPAQIKKGIAKATKNDDDWDNEPAKPKTSTSKLNAAKPEEEESKKIPTVQGTKIGQKKKENDDDDWEEETKAKQWQRTNSIPDSKDKTKTEAKEEPAMNAMKPQPAANRSASTLPRSGSSNSVAEQQKQLAASAQIQRSQSNLAATIVQPHFTSPLAKNASRDVLSQKSMSRAGSTSNVSRRPSESEEGAEDPSESIVDKLKRELMYDIRKELGSFKREVIEVFKIELLKLTKALAGEDF